VDIGAVRALGREAAPAADLDAVVAMARRNVASFRRPSKHGEHALPHDAETVRAKAPRKREDLIGAASRSPEVGVIVVPSQPPAHGIVCHNRTVNARGRDVTRGSAPCSTAI
jgi:hypothetical protein